MKIRRSAVTAFLLLSASMAAAAGTGREITIFLDRDGSLTPVPVVVPWTEHTEERIKESMELLILGETGFTRTLPKGTKIKRVFIDAAKVIYLDFSKELVKGHPGGIWTETLTITSISKTIFANFEAHSIKIMVEGKELKTLAGHIDLKAPLTRERVGLWLGEGEI